MVGTESEKPEKSDKSKLDGRKLFRGSKSLYAKNAIKRVSLHMVSYV